MKKQMLATLAFLASIAFLLSCNQDETAFGPQDGQAFESSVAGRVTDRNGKPLSGALVTSIPGGATTVTGPDGSFTLDRLRAGSYRIALAKDDYRDTLWLDSVRLGLSVNRDIGALGMRYRYATIRGVVEDSSGAAQPMAAIAVEDQMPTTMAQSGGKFTLGRVEPGRVRLFTAIQGMGYGSLDTVLQADDTLKDLRLRINRRGGVVTGQVVDADGKGISGATVQTVGGALKTTTDGDGIFRISEVPGGGKVVVEVVKGELSTMVTGVRVAEGSKTDLSKITIAVIASTGSVSIRTGLAMAMTTDSVVTLVADAISNDSSFRILRYLWSLDNGSTWDTTSTNVFVVFLDHLGWTSGNHDVLVKAISVDGTPSATGTITVRLMLPPDWIVPTVARVSPKEDTTRSWKDSLLTFAWKVSDNRKLDTVWIDDVKVDGDNGIFSREVGLKLGRNPYALTARDSSGNISRDTIWVARSARGTTKPSLRKVTPQRDTTYAYTDSTTKTVAWSVIDADGLDTVWLDGKPVQPDSVNEVKTSLKISAGESVVVRIHARDASGNESFDSVELTRLAYDTTRPNISRVSPKQDTTIANKDTSLVVAWKVSDAGTGLDSVWIDNKGVAVDTTGVVEMIVKPAAGASTMVRIRARDRAGVFNHDSLKITRLVFDTTRPTVVLQRPGKDTTVPYMDTSVIVTWSVSDEGTGLDTVWVQGLPAKVVNGKVTNAVKIVGEKTVVRIRARDLAGQEKLDSVTVTRKAASADTLGIPGLVAYWPFDGDAKDRSGNGNDGVVNGAALTRDRFGKDSASFWFDGTSDWIKGSSSGLPTAERTVSVWFNAEDLTGGRILLSYGGGQMGTSWLMMLNNQTLGINTYEMQGHGTINRINAPYEVPPLNDWYHFCVVTSSAGTKLYVNDSMLASNANFANNTNVADKDLAIGVATESDGTDPYTDANGTYFKGRIDDIRIYNRALTATEINAIYREGGWKGPTPPPDTVQLAVVVPRNDADTLWPLDTIRATSTGEIEYSIDSGAWTSYPSAGIVLAKACSLSVRATESGKIAKSWGRRFEFTTWNPAITYAKLHDDRDGKEYRTVRIGTQTWMAENLNFKGLGADSGWWYDNSPDKGAQYGRLYTWAAAMGLPGSCNTVSCSTLVQPKHKGICPDGWHVPSDGEWGELARTAGSNASELKSTLGWASSPGPMDIHGFRALSGGDRDSGGGFVYEGDYGHWVTATEYSAAIAWYRVLASADDAIYRDIFGTKSYAFSLRCIQGPAEFDTSTALVSLTTDSGIFQEPFDSNLLVYTDSVSHSLTILKVRPKASSPRATITYDSVVAVPNDTTINVKVTNVYGLTRTYTIHVRHKVILPQDTTLSSLVVSAGTLIPDFAPNVFAYADTIYDSLVTIRARAKDAANAAIAIGGEPRDTLKIGLASGATDTVKIRVMAKDGDSLEYSVSLHRLKNYGVPWTQGPSYGVLKDVRDGRQYRTVKIGTQTWMAENLSYNSVGSYVYGNRTDVDSITKYGRLYSWSNLMALAPTCNSASCAGQIAAKHQGICPSGWHVPSDSEWQVLEVAIGMDPDTAKVMGIRGTGLSGKLKSLSGWSGQGNGSDPIGFRALPAGERVGQTPTFSYMGSAAYFWTATETQTTYGYYRTLEGGNTTIYRWGNDKGSSFLSARCLEN